MTNPFEIVTKYCCKNLFENEEVLSYLVNERKISIEAIEKWEIGLFPQDLRGLFSIVDPSDLRSASIVKHASRSMFQSHDIVMPIKNVYGEHIALAGRTRLSEEQRSKIRLPKYLNTVYSKTHHLFGLDVAKESIIKNDIVYVVEGYFDVISPHQKGFCNVVATCGAYLSTRHLVLLSRYTNNIVLCLDNEEAAQEKAIKIVEKKQREGINLSRKCPLPNGYKDIDQYLKDHSVDDFMRLLKSKDTNYFDFKPLLD